MKLTVQLYGQFLMSSQVNYTGMYLVDYLDELTHDNVRYFLKKTAFHVPLALVAGGTQRAESRLLRRHDTRRVPLTSY